MAAFVACVALAAPAQAQFDPFHRQAPPADIPGDPGQTAELVLRVNQLEEELRQANGRIEELENAEHRLETELQKFRQDVEYRFGDHSEGAPRRLTSLKPPKAPASRPRQQGRGSRRTRSIPTPTRTRPARRGRSEPHRRARHWCARRRGPLRVNRSSSARPRRRIEQGTAAPERPTIVGSGVAMLDQPREQFNAALQAFQAGQYPEAEAGFKAFLAANPSHRMSADAIFYIGETYLQRSRPREAAEQYLKVTTDYSKSSRAPESMVRLGQTLAALGNNEQACATLTEFGKRYPAASASVKKLAEHESAKDHC